MILCKYIYTHILTERKKVRERERERQRKGE
jgi:hypothetical protein